MMSLHHIVDLEESTEKYAVIEVDDAVIDNLLQGLECDYDDVKYVDDIEDDMVEKGIAHLSNGYRGRLVYRAFVFMNGKWWDVGLVSQGDMWPFKDTEAFDRVYEQLKAM